MCYNSSPWQQTPPSFYRPQQTPSLELYGNAISLNKAGGGGGGGGGGGSRKSSARRRPMGQAYNNYRYTVSHPGLSVQGLSVNDRVKHLKHLSTASNLSTS
ncbi:PREDICTED: uncharacterized protein LOC109582315 [Amphimedon queenslandica]|nr:PREDICTED: uncharacterized protein LOC109582315 [Amphimedon queenslandica]|eukprot:XP_019852546.1 PREDICTED: uncharacterized protein LOC109582315 [Amphimedon queenslandica]